MFGDWNSLEAVQKAANYCDELREKCLRENQSIKDPSIEKIECKIRRCNAIAKSTEKRCKRCVSNEGDYQCYQHNGESSFEWYSEIIYFLLQYDCQSYY